MCLLYKNLRNYEMKNTLEFFPFHHYIKTAWKCEESLTCRSVPWCGDCKLGTMQPWQPWLLQCQCLTDLHGTGRAVLASNPLLI